MNHRKNIPCNGPSADKIKQAHRKRYKSLCTQMQNLLNEISEYCPDVNIYVEDDSNWELMIGPSHNDNNGDLPSHDNVAVSCTVSPSSGGAW